MPGIQAQLPAGMKGGIPFDSSVYIRDSIREVLKTLTETLLIVVLVIFLFLGSVRSVIIPVVAIPISLIGAVFIMQAAGFTINLLTLLAIVLSVGLVVDDAIVMVENVERHLHEGKSPFQAALDAARELVGPIIAMTITLAAVYTPVAIQGGLDRLALPRVRLHARRRGDRLRHRGADPVADDGLEAPARRRHRARLRRLRQPAVRVGSARLHAAAQRARCSYRPVVLTLWVIVMLLIVPFYMFSQKELAPAEDQGVVFGIIQAGANATIDQTKLFADEIYKVFQSFPETDSTFQIVFPTGGFAGMVVKPVERAEEEHRAAPGARRRRSCRRSRACG